MSHYCVINLHLQCMSQSQANATLSLSSIVVTVHGKYLAGENFGKPCRYVKAIGKEKFGE